MTPQVVFACVRNGDRSVISRVLTEHYAGGRVRALLVELVPDIVLPPSMVDGA
jgi:ArsR family transcriptional regulator